VSNEEVEEEKRKGLCIPLIGHGSSGAVKSSYYFGRPDISLVTQCLMKVSTGKSGALIEQEIIGASTRHAKPECRERGRRESL
jgi:hypothetical protein